MCAQSSFCLYSKVFHNSVLSIWRRDRTLLAALDVCKALIGPADYLTAMWPSQGKQNFF